LPGADGAPGAAGAQGPQGVQGVPGLGAVSAGYVVQQASKSTNVTLNKQAGTIETHAEGMAAGASVSFQFGNSFASPGDLVVINVRWDAVANPINYEVSAATYQANGVILIVLKNRSGGVLSGAVKINFMVLKVA
jgi:hypothetical protein